MHDRIQVALGALVLLCATLFACDRARCQPQQAASDEADRYQQVIRGRADKIVATLDIDDEATAARVRDLIASFYHGLRDIHDVRDTRLGELKDTPAGDPTIAEAWSKTARDQASLKQNELHRHFVARLESELSPAQVEAVKDGLTYGVVRITYNRYLELLPQLSDEQKREILAHLIEAREYAMDGGSSEEKHAIFGKYKGRINNYLSAQGFDLKAAERELAAQDRSARQER